MLDGLSGVAGGWRSCLTARRFVLLAAALLPPAALAVHELRYRLAFGDETGSAVAAHGHGHLAIIAPIVALLCAAGCARLLLCVARGATDVAPRVALPRMWAACAVALLAVYGGQELLEGALSPGHAAGLDAILAGRGWLALPLCILVGFALAGVLRLARVVAERRARRHAAVRPAVARAAWQPARSRVVLPCACPLARRLAGRAPPIVA